MALFSIFKGPKNQQFEYKPRYWNPRKENLEERIRNQEADPSDPEALKARISAGFRRGSGYGYQKQKNQDIKRSNMFLIAIIITLLFISYLFLSVYLPEIVEAVEGNPYKND